MKIYKKNIYEIIMIIMIILNEKFVYLIDSNSSLASDILILIVIVSIVFNWKNILKTRYRFLKVILSYLVLNLITLIITILKFGQPISLAILRYRNVLLFLSYLYIYELVRKLGTEKIRYIMYRMGTILSIAYVCQAMVYPKIVVFNMNYMDRDGSLRFFYGNYFIILTIFITINLLYDKFEKRKLISLIIQMGYIVFIAQIRSVIIGLMITFLVVLLNKMKKITYKRILALFLTIIIIYPIFAPSLNNIIESSKNTMLTKTSSSYISRVGAMEFAINKIKENPIFGIGLYNNNYDNSGIITGSESKFYADDIGILGFMFQYGFLGIFIFGVMIWKMIYIVRKLKFRKSRVFYQLFLVYTVVLLPFNIPLNIANCILYLMVILSMIEIDYNTQNGEQNFKFDRKAI